MSLNLGQLAQEPVSLTMTRARHIAEGILRQSEGAAFMNVSYTPTQIIE
jgi:hypothetical protein